MGPRNKNAPLARHLTSAGRDVTDRRVGQFPAVKSIVTLSRSSVDRLEARGEFPPRIALTPKTSVWDLDAVQKWLELRISASAAVAAERAPVGKQLAQARANARQAAPA